MAVEVVTLKKDFPLGIYGEAYELDTVVVEDLRAVGVLKEEDMHYYLASGFKMVLEEDNQFNITLKIPGTSVELEIILDAVEYYFA